jgi:hypothetical protein
VPVALFGFCRRLSPDRFVKINVAPAQREDFAEAGAGIHPDFDDVYAVGVLWTPLVHCGLEPLELLIPQIALAPVLGVSFDTGGRVISAHLPNDSLGE